MFDGGQSTCLHIAARQGHALVIDALLGDDSYVLSKDGERVLLRKAVIINAQGQHHKVSSCGSSKQSIRDAGHHPALLGGRSSCDGGVRMRSCGGMQQEKRPAALEALAAGYRLPSNST